MAGKTKKPETPVAAQSVAAGIFAEFCEAVTADETIPGVGERLKKVLIEDRDFSDTALRQALFGEAES